MRLWSIHPCYLDRQGLLAVWREALLAQQVLLGATKGYGKHPQLDRFKKQKEPLRAIAAYLTGIHQEAEARGYAFDKEKILTLPQTEKILVTEGQLYYEWEHFLSKLRLRDEKRYQELKDLERIKPHCLFSMVQGNIESFERR